MKTRSLFLLLACLLVLSLPVLADDWPQWQGPNRDNVSKETGLLKTWPKDGPKLLWTFEETGTGYSGPAVVGDRLFILGTTGSGNDQKEAVLCLDVATGKSLWSAEIGPMFNNGYGGGPRSTPTVDGDLLYVLGAGGELACLETATGKKRWGKDVKRDLGGQMMSGWGYSESPLVDGDQVVCSPGGKQGTLAALDKHSGEVIWRSKDLTDAAAYSSMIAAEIGGVRQYVQTTGQAVVGVAARDGKLLWRFPKQEYRTAVIPTPIVRDDLVYVTAGYGVGCDLLRIAQDSQGTFKAERVYDRSVLKNVENKHEGVVLVGDFLYGWTDHGNEWVCQEFKTGKLVWESKALGRGSVMSASGDLYCYSEDGGVVVLAEASPDGWKEHGRFTIPRKSAAPRPQYPKNIWAHPVVANGRLYLRDQELLFSFDVHAGQ